MIESDVARELVASAAWCAERKRWRDEAECRHERGEAEEIGNELAAYLMALESNANVVSSAPASAFSCTAETLDREIRRLCTQLSERDLALGIVAERARAHGVPRARAVLGGRGAEQCDLSALR